MKEGGVDASFFAIYVSNKWEPYECTFKALEAFASVYDMLDKHPDKAGLATDAQTARALKQQGKIAIFLGMENAGPIHRDLSLLRLFHKMGVRYITLTHAGNNEVCDSSATKEKRWNGVSPFGRELIAEMNRLGCWWMWHIFPIRLSTTCSNIPPVRLYRLILVAELYVMCPEILQIR